MNEEKAKRIGGLYSRTSKKGLDYFKGFIEVEGKKVNFVVFKNTKKFDENTPDYSLFPSEPLGDNAPARQTAGAGAGAGANSGGFGDNDELSFP